MVDGTQVATLTKSGDVVGEGALFGKVRNATVEASSKIVEALMLPQEHLAMFAQVKNQFEKISSKRAHENASVLEKMNWRDRVRLQTLGDEESVVVERGEKEEVVTEEQ